MSIGTGNLPEGWAAGQTKDGEIYYINHALKMTTWDRPRTVASPPAYSEPGTLVVPPTSSVEPTVGAAAVKHSQAAATPGPIPTTQLGCCSFFGTRIFWTSAGLSWLVWIFSVACAGDENWLLSDGEGAGIPYKDSACDQADANDAACAAYESFVATQCISSVTFSLAVVLYTAAFFRPSNAELGSTTVLGLVGGILTALATFFQMLAFIFADKRVEENNQELGGGFENGPTFALGVTTFVFGFIQSIIVLLSFSSAGDGPLLPLVRGWEISNKLQVSAYPSQTQAMMAHGARGTTSIQQDAQIEASTQQGATLAPPGDAPPPAYTSNQGVLEPPQPHARGASLPPTYDDNVNVGSSSI